MKNTDKKDVAAAPVKSFIATLTAAKISKITVAVFFVAVWALLAFGEGATLFRVAEQSLFLYNGHFFREAMALPAGFLSYLGAFFIQFFHYPVLGATVYVALLAALYLLTKKVFDIPARWSLLALLPVALVLAYSTQLGYWIFYIKIQGFYYMALLATLASLLVAWVCLKFKGLYAPVILLWTVGGYMLFGAYALGGAVVIAVASLVDRIKGRYGPLYVASAALMLVAVCVLAYAVPQGMYHYNIYSNTMLSHMPFAGLPVHQWVDNVEMYPNGIFEYWLPIVLLPVVYLLLALLRGSLAGDGSDKKFRPYAVAQVVVVACVVAFTAVYWYSDVNFDVENKQNKAMWEEDWEAVAAYAMDSKLPTRQIVLNKNMALLKLGRLGEDAFKYPDGSSDIAHPGVVHLTQTGGMMNYYQYGKFNFCYRWCIENAVEYGWRAEYLKHAARCMLLSGQHKLAMRYIDILKETLFYRSWACEMEEYVNNPQRISKQEEFRMPLLMYSYPDALELDDSYVEVYLSKSLSNTHTKEDARIYAEAAVVFALVRKDVNLFWDTMSRYISKGKLTRVPHHFQEAIILFTNLNKDITTNIPIDFKVKTRFESFINKVQEHKGMKEEEMAPLFVEEYGDTYWYFYFFVRNIKTN